ncbi:hypothetical protein [Pseudomonas putida]|uniref:Uncharacterized protein n=1 Tax=Pseudomonas putida TaxID=303 RepID=A0A6S5T5S4_PSEPU|nr:hypothetical protein [Pseudomonas putida]BBT38808.1 hypothetical protein WP8W18C01_11490 [Pseudomonas putida]
MPTENRSNTEMVSDMLPPCADDVFKNGVSACLVGDVPKHAAETICQSLSAITGWKIDWHYIGGRTHIKALAPAEQHQGELLAWQDPDNDSRMCTAEHKAYALSKGGAPAAALSTLTRPLYSRPAPADPGEVERLRARISELENHCKRLGQGDAERYWEGRWRDADANLAERDALLRKISGYHWANVDPEERARTRAELRDMLSASAEPTARELHALQIEKSLGIERLPVEPSAPVIHPINMKTMMQAYEQVDHKAMLHGTSNWCAAMAAALRGTLHSETGAPVEPLYQKCTVLKDAEVRYSNSTAPVERDERALIELALSEYGKATGNHVLPGGFNEKQDSFVQGFLVCATLDRKPS